jgi:hypothetical protein
MIELDCPECGKLFEKTHWRKRFCSFPCQNRTKARNWRAANPEQAKVLDKRTREKCRDRRLPRMRAWHHANKNAQNAKRRVWHHGHKEQANANRSALYYADHEQNKEKQKVRNYDSRIDTPWRKLLHSARQRACKKKVPFFLTDAWGEKSWTGRCAITNLPFEIGLRTSGPKMFSPSIDRIVPSLGYVPENCRFVLWAVNAFKSVGTDQDMILIARAILEYFEPK